MLRIHVSVASLQKDLEFTFGSIPAILANETYLGNLAARRYAVIVEQ